MTTTSATHGASPDRCAVCGAAVSGDGAGPAGISPCDACGHQIWFRWTDEGGMAIVRPLGPTLSLVVVERIADLVRARDEDRSLVLDLTEIDGISSTVIARLVELRKHLTARGGTLTIRNLHPDLLEVFRITRLDHVFGIG